MIEKKIHIFWFGRGDKSLFINCLNNKLHNFKDKGYEILEWDESNYDVYKNDYTSYCYNNKKWAHLSDYARLDILYQFGGIYLDQDVEVLKEFDDILKYKLFLGYMFDCNLGTAVIGSEKKNVHIKKILNLYSSEKISVDSPNNDLFTKYFIENVNGFKLDGKGMEYEGIKIFSKEYFEQPSFLKKKNYTIHHFDNSWRKKSRFKVIVQTAMKKTIGIYLYRLLMCKKALKISPFYSEWKKNQ